MNLSHVRRYLPERKMSRSFTRHKRSAAWRKCWSTIASRHTSAAASEPCTRRERERSNRAAATRARKAVHARIVEAFRKFLEGTGKGPADEDLQTFAKLAIAEQRLRRRLGLAKASGKESRRGL